MMDHLVSLPKSNNDIITPKHLALWFWCLRLEMAAVAVTLAVEETHLDREFGPYTWFVFGCIYGLERNAVTSDLLTLKTTLNARVKHATKLLNFAVVVVLLRGSVPLNFAAARPRPPTITTMAKLSTTATITTEKI